MKIEVFRTFQGEIMFARSSSFIFFLALKSIRCEADRKKMVCISTDKANRKNQMYSNAKNLPSDVKLLSHACGYQLLPCHHVYKQHGIKALKLRFGVRK